MGKTKKITSYLLLLSMSLGTFGALPSREVFAQTDHEPPQDMVAWYKFDEVTTQPSIVLDASGNERHAEIVNGAMITDLHGE